MLSAGRRENEQTAAFCKFDCFAESFTQQTQSGALALRHRTMEELMDVKQLQYFMEVSNTGSFTAAAKRLYLSVPGLVKSMDRLEEELGAPLFVRMRSGVALTPACAELYPPA